MEQEPCDTSLALGLGAAVDAFAAARRRCALEQKPPVRFHALFPTCAKEWAVAREEQGKGGLQMRTVEEEDVVEEARESSGGSNANSGGGGGSCSRSAMKKLRLTKEQSALLENSFRERNTLTLTQKQELANRLSLRLRQVEVWFQNRRARTKLKQTELDCKFLKKCCENLSDENRKLKKELQELRSIKSRLPFQVQLPMAAKLTMCPSCERIATVDGKIHGAAGFDAVAAAMPRFYNCAINDLSTAFKGDQDGLNPSSSNICR